MAAPARARSQPSAVPSASCGESGERREVRPEEEVRRSVTESYIHPEGASRITILDSRFPESLRSQMLKNKIFQLYKSVKLRVRAVMLTALCGTVQGCPHYFQKVSGNPAFFRSLCKNE